MNKTNTVLWSVTPCSLVYEQEKSKDTCSLHLQGQKHSSTVKV